MTTTILEELESTNWQTSSLEQLQHHVRLLQQEPSAIISILQSLFSMKTTHHQVTDNRRARSIGPCICPPILQSQQAILKWGVINIRPAYLLEIIVQTHYRVAIEFLQASMPAHTIGDTSWM